MNNRQILHGSSVPTQNEVSSGTLYVVPSYPADASGMPIRPKSDTRLKKSDLTASIVADMIINFCNDHGNVITNLKLQKLLYYTQAWYLAFYNQPLFQDRIEAWVYGPAQPDVYSHFSPFGHKPIDYNPVKWTPASSKIRLHIEEVMSAYGGKTAYDLERLSCSEDPWNIAREGVSPDKSSSEQISHDSMRTFYRSRINE